MRHYHSSAIVNLVLSFLKIDANLSTPKGNRVSFSVLFLAIGIIGFILSGGFTIFTLLQKDIQEHIWIVLLVSLLNLLPLSIIIAFINSRVIYDESGFTHKNFFGIKRKYTYDQITGIRFAPNETFLYVGKRKIMIDELHVGHKEFIFFVKKQYHKVYKNEIPRIKPEKDIFNGNVQGASGFILVFVILAVCGVMLNGLFCYLVFSPKTESNTDMTEARFTSCYQANGMISLRSTDNEYYRLSYSDEYFSKISALCDGEKLLTVYSNKVNSDSGNDYYSIEAIKYNGEFILSFEETYKIQVKLGIPLLIIGLIFDLLIVGFICTVIIVGRNPRKFSKKTVRLFFKEGHIQY